MPDQVRQDAWTKLGNLCVHSAKFDSPQRQPFSQCLQGTRVQLLDALRKTIRTQDQKIIWLFGESGTGKSAIAHTLAQEFSSSDALAASFFFSRRHDIRSTTDRFIPTIAYQLGLFHPHAQIKIIDALVRDPALLDPDRSREDQLTRLILAPLRELKMGWKDSKRKILMILDALDECEPGLGNHQLRQLVYFCVKALQGENSANFHVVMTSRPYDSINDAMSQTSSIIPLDIDDYNASEDIELFLRSSFRRMGSHPSVLWPSESDLSLLLEKVARRFIVATTVMRMLEQKRPPERRSFLCTLLQTGQLNSIDELYRGVITTSQYSSKAAWLVVIILSLQQPLSTPELSHLLHFEVRPMLDSIAAIISVPPTNSRELVSTYHTSIRDFFWDATRSQNLYVDPAVAHSHLASSSLALLNDSLTRDICGLGDASLLHSEIEDFDIKREAAISSALEYAVTHWLHHLHESPPDSRLQELLSLFAKQHILHWIEAASIVGSLNSCIASLFKALARVKTWQSIADQEYINDLLYDAYRLMNEFLDCISESSLHVYHTAIPLCPTQASLRLEEHYAAHVKKASTVVIEGLDDKWSPIIREISFNGGLVVCVSFDARLVAVVRKTIVEIWDITAGLMRTSHDISARRSIFNCAFARDSSSLAYSSVYQNSIGRLSNSSLEVHVWSLSTNMVLLIDNTPPSTKSLRLRGEVAISSLGDRVAWATEETLSVSSKDRNGAAQFSLNFKRNFGDVTS
ncbi:hypothetical protein CONPUDRAFT_106901, partial [Coniophora puteana RWD-64-598 SS2]